MDGQKSKVRFLVLFTAFLLILALAAAVYFTGRRETADDVPAPLLPIAEAKDSGVLKAGSRWTGLLTVTEHRGEGVLEDGTRAIRGVIGQTAEGTYFELFHREDPDSAEPILSLWVTLEGDEMRPIISEDDAWYFDILLDARDVEPFTLRPEAGEISQHYFYDSGTETCWIDFHIKPEKKS